MGECGSNRSTIHHALLSPLAFLLAFLLLAGCEEGVDPNLGSDRPFTVWGLLNPEADTQAVRLFEIEPTLRLLRPEPLDAVVTSTNLTTGDVRVWRDTLVQLADGDLRHVYFSTFRAVHDHRYRIEVERSDGATSTAEVTVPLPVDLEVLTPSENQVSQITLPVLVRGEPPNLPRIDVTYDVTSFADDGSARHDKNITVSYDGTQVPVTEGFQVPIDLRADFEVIFFAYFNEQLPARRIVLNEMSITVHIGDENWVSPVGFFDPNFLVEPGTLTNVENGFGFVGSGFIRATSWLPPALLQARAGFFIEGTGK